MTDLELTELGDGEQPVLFVHGVLDRGRAFAGVAEVLMSECRMWWYDRRGYGASADAPGAPLTLDGQADDLIAIIDELPVEQPIVLAAHSFGGMSALYAALARPDRIGAIALYETGMAWLPGWPNDRVGELFFVDEDGSAAMEAIFGRQLDQLEPAARARRELEGRAFVIEQRTVRSPGYVPPDFGQLRVPLVYGRGDADMPWDLVTDYLAGLVPRFEAVRIAGASHNGHRSHPAEVAALVRRAIALMRA
jgi:pimeloyl-ACP methyl ester carboxylesterase